MKIESKHFYRELWSLALPITVQSLLVATLNMADVMMVGGLGDEAVAAVGLGAKLHFVTLLFVFGFGNACNVLVSQYVGAGQYSKVKQILLLTILTGVGLLLPVVLLFGVSPESWLSFISDDAEVVSLTADYLQVTAVVIALMVVILTCENVLRAIGETGVPLLFTTISIGCNILLNYILIFGKWGAPELGVVGAAWATLISRALHVLLFVVYLKWSNHFLLINRTDLLSLKNIESWISYCKFALPVAFNFVLWGLGSAVYHFIASRTGTDALAVMSILAPIEHTVISAFLGFSGAASILLGRALGANQFDYAWQLKLFFVRKAVLFGVLVGGIMWWVMPLVLSPFESLDSSTQDLVNTTYLIMCGLVWIKVHNLMSMVSVLRAGGDTLFCLKIDVTAMWIIGLPLTALAAFYFELPFVYVYLVMFIEEVVKMIASHWRMYQKFWIRNLTDIIPSSVVKDI